MKLPRLLKDHIFIENNKIGFWKNTNTKFGKQRSFFFEFETPLPNMLNLFEAMTNAKTEDEMEMLADELMVQKLKITSEILE